MADSLPIPPPGFDDLSVEDKIEYVSSLWDRIAAKPDEVPVPDWHRKVIEERLQEYRAAPDEGKSWKEVREQVERALREPSE